MKESDLSAAELAELDRGEGPLVRFGDEIYDRNYVARMSDPGDYRIVDPDHRMVSLTWEQQVRAAGVLVGTAVGDAVGVHYELGSAPLPPRPGVSVDMLGGGLGNFEPGEWSDDTAMAVCVAEVGADGVDLGSSGGLDRIAGRFLDWAKSGPPDMGVQTRAVLGDGRRDRGPGLGARLAGRARLVHERSGRTAGNGALMRTAPVGVAHVHDRGWVRSRAARAVAELTHADPLAGDSCVIWTEAVSTAIRSGTTDGVRAGVELLPEGRRAAWAEWLTQAENRPAGSFCPNGFTVTALQAAYAAVLVAQRGGGSPADRFVAGIEAAVRVGDDTDTVAAIAGGLLGALYGYEVIPQRWTSRLHGWPSFGIKDIVGLGFLGSRIPRPENRPTADEAP